MHVINRTWQTLVVLGLTLIAVSFFGLFSSPAVGVSGSTNQCSDPNAKIFEPLQGEIISGSVETRVSPGSVDAQRVKIYVDPANGDQQLVGESDNVGSHWYLNWDSSYANSGSGEASIFAIFYQANFDPICRTPFKQVFIQNDSTTTNPAQSLEVKIMINGQPIQDWTGPPNIPVSLEARAFISGSNIGEVTNSTQFTWSARQVGSIQPSGKYATFSSGPIKGDGSVKVIANFNGQTAIDEFATHVRPSSQTGSFPTIITENDSNTTAGSNSSASHNDAFGDPKLETCLTKVLGEDEYSKISQSGARLSYQEFVKSHDCFAGNRYVVPANLAPIPPEQIESLRESSNVSIKSIIESFDQGQQAITGLTLRGLAEPNQNIMIYVFSEPLVLTTTADESGSWSYTIEDPLEPGEHTAYVAVEDASGEFVRSQSFFFSVAQAASTEENPNGLSFDLEDSVQSSYAAFLLTASVLVAIALIIFTITIRRKSKNNDQPGALDDHGISRPPSNIAPEA